MHSGWRLSASKLDTSRKRAETYRHLGTATRTVLKTVPQSSVYELIDKGMIPVLKFKSFRIRKSSLEKFLEKYESYQSND